MLHRVSSHKHERAETSTCCGAFDWARWVDLSEHQRDPIIVRRFLAKPGANERTGVPCGVRGADDQPQPAQFRSVFPSVTGRRRRLEPRLDPYLLSGLQYTVFRLPAVLSFWKPAPFARMACAPPTGHREE